MSWHNTIIGIFFKCRIAKSFSRQIFSKVHYLSILELFLHSRLRIIPGKETNYLYIIIKAFVFYYSIFFLSWQIYNKQDNWLGEKNEDRLFANQAHIKSFNLKCTRILKNNCLLEWSPGLRLINLKNDSFKKKL